MKLRLLVSKIVLLIVLIVLLLITEALSLNPQDSRLPDSLWYTSPRFQTRFTPMAVANRRLWQVIGPLYSAHAWVDCMTIQRQIPCRRQRYYQHVSVKRTNWSRVICPCIGHLTNNLRVASVGPSNDYNQCHGKVSLRLRKFALGSRHWWCASLHISWKLV